MIVTLIRVIVTLIRVVFVFDVVAGFRGAVSGLVDLTDPLARSHQRQDKTDTNSGDTDFASAPRHALPEAKNDGK